MAGELVVTGITQPMYTSKIIKASALLADTKILLSSWNEADSIEENLRRVRRENILGKASRSRAEDVLAIFRQRYFTDPSVGRALAILARAGFPAEAFDPILYFYSAQADPLLHDTVVEFIQPMRERGDTEVRLEDVCEMLSNWVRDGKTQGEWSQNTTRRVAQGLLITLRDFGILQGVKRKFIRPVYLPTKAFAFIAFELHRKQASGRELLHHSEWQLFFLTLQTVERFFLEAHQEKLLEYHAAGPVIRVEFPRKTIEEYAYDLTQR